MSLGIHNHECVMNNSFRRNFPQKRFLFDYRVTRYKVFYSYFLRWPLIFLSFCCTYKMTRIFCELEMNAFFNIDSFFYFLTRKATPTLSPHVQYITLNVVDSIPSQDKYFLVLK